jgi:hypothetical protein
MARRLRGITALKHRLTRQKTQPHRAAGGDT